MNELLKAKEDLTRERDEQLGEIVKLRESLTEAANSQQKAEQDKVEAEKKIAEVSRSQIIASFLVDPTRPGKKIPMLSAVPVASWDKKSRQPGLNSKTEI